MVLTIVIYQQINTYNKCLNIFFADQLSMVEFLLKSGADINLKTNWGDVPIHAAASKGIQFQDLKLF